MTTFNTYFTSEFKLHEFINQHKLQDSPQLLIQVFTAKNDRDFIFDLTQFFSRHFPLSSLIGVTTDGEVKDGFVSTHKTVISFTMFEKVYLTSYISDTFETYYEAGKNMASALVGEETKAIIAFIDGLSGNGEAFLNAIGEIAPEVIVAGGLAGDNATFTKTYLFTKELIVSGGVIGVSLSSPSLNIFTDYSFNWIPIGKTLQITHADNNRVYTIDDKTAVDTYNFYLGKSVGNQLPFIGIEFPLIIQRNGLNIARAPISQDKDGSLLFAGNFKNGDKVRFGYGDADTILSETQKHINHFSDIPIETIFIYSCMARRRFIPLQIEHETLVYNQIAPTSGFFTYGEFFSSTTKKELLNQSMTILALSESDISHHHDLVFDNSQYKSTTIRALAHLINISVKELESTQQKLKDLASTDPLTGLHNRRSFSEVSITLFNLAFQEKKPLTAIMLDIDKFKQINDTYGHLNGDCVLISLAELLQKFLRETDFICRYGGEEFVILLPDTNTNDALVIAEKLRKMIEITTITLSDNQIIHYTISLGISEINSAKDSRIEQVVNRADEALYIAKDEGRNKVVVR